VRVTGHLPEDEVSKLLAAADVAVFPFTAGVTVKSGGMLAALEHRVPVVATAAEPPDPHLEHERHLLLVRRRDPGALAVAVSRLLTDRALGARLADEGARLARRHGWSWIAAAHMDLYRGLSARHPTTPSPARRA
jgi:glycosyltransferase involved in cell wall biosynthesis